MSALCLFLLQLKSFPLLPCFWSNAKIQGPEGFLQLRLSGVGGTFRKEKIERRNTFRRKTTLRKKINFLSAKYLLMGNEIVQGIRG